MISTLILRRTAICQMRQASYLLHLKYRRIQLSVSGFLEMFWNFLISIRNSGIILRKCIIYIRTTFYLPDQLKQFGMTSTFSLFILILLTENKLFDPTQGSYLTNAANLVFTAFELSKHPTFR